MVFSSVKYFCCSSSYFHKSLAVFFYSLCCSIFSDYLKDCNYIKSMLRDNSHIFSFLLLFFTVKTHSTLRCCHKQDLLIYYQLDVKFSFIGSRIPFLIGNELHQQHMFWFSLRTRSYII